MANLLHQNKKMNVFEVLEAIETLRFEESFADGESVSSANVIIFSPENEDMDTAEKDGNGVNCIPDNLCGRQLLSAAKLDLLGTGGSNLIISSGYTRICLHSALFCGLTDSCVPIDSRVQLISECNLLFEKEICSCF